MTEKEYKLLETLTKQVELNNKLLLKQNQNREEDKYWEDSAYKAEIEYTKEKERLCRNAATLISIISVVTCIVCFLLFGLLAAFIGEFL